MDERGVQLQLSFDIYPRQVLQGVDREGKVLINTGRACVVVRLPCLLACFFFFLILDFSLPTYYVVEVSLSLLFFIPFYSFLPTWKGGVDGIDMGEACGGRVCVCVGNPCS